MLTSDQKGAITETAIAHAATRLGIGVSKPLAAGERYDLIFDLHPGLLRVQCKWASLQDDVVVVRCYSSSRRRDGLVRRPYDADEIDAVAAYCAGNDRCYFFPVSTLAGQRNLQLRLAPPRNNQGARIRWASRFEFESLDWNELKLGP